MAAIGTTPRRLFGPRSASCGARAAVAAARYRRPGVQLRPGHRQRAGRDRRAAGRAGDLRVGLPDANDATLGPAHHDLITNAWFDAIAPYHETAVGVYSRLGRRPTEESQTNRNQNIAIVYASYRVLNSVLPNHAQDWRAMVSSTGLDPTTRARTPQPPSAWATSPAPLSSPPANTTG